MNKRGVIIAIFAIFFLVYNNTLYANCEEERINLNKTKNQYESTKTKLDSVVDDVIASKKGGNIQKEINEKQNMLSKELINNREEYEKSKKEFDKCISLSKSTNESTNNYILGIEALQKGDIEKSIDYFKKHIKENPEDSNAKGSLLEAYFIIGKNTFLEKEYKKSISYFKEAVKIDINSPILKNNIYFILGNAYYSLGDYEKATTNFYNAADYSQDDDNYYLMLEFAQESNAEEIKEYSSISNDPYVGNQYYLKQLKIPEAWKKVKKNNEVIVAVIDDGMHINHPDLKDVIWTNPKANYGSSKVINFTWDGLDNFAAGEHGTNVAGIIGAQQNNKTGIAGIAKNVKIMPLRVFTSTGASLQDMTLNALNYAIDNGADIVNISLGSSQFYSYSDFYDKAIKRAYDKGIIVVIAAGNGDINSNNSSGLDLTNNPVSPVCNNKANNKYSIGVGATGRDGYDTYWSNYGNCVNIKAPGDKIFTTSVPMYNKMSSHYNKVDGTSFSAPIVSGIIALGFNQYGKVSPDIVFDALQNSIIINEEDGYRIDAEKYIDELGKKIK